jgi:CubicO group peptidase (beta-lactamase class C family)
VLVATAGATEPASLDAELAALCAEHAVPGMAAAVWQDGRVVAQGVAGVRKAGAPQPVALGDKFSIGSCTKSVTATLAAVLVEQGRARWETTLAEAFPQWRASMLPEWREVTLGMLLAHTAGVPPNTSDLAPSVNLRMDTTLLPRDQRASMTRQLLQRQRPVSPPGERFTYSNLSYLIAGHMVEVLGQGRYEDLVRRLVFAPLGMASAGFGAPAYPGRVDQPWGHYRSPTVPLSPVPGGKAYNPPHAAPVGTGHASTLDLLTYLVAHLRGERGEDPPLLAVATWRTLHRAHFPPSTYAYGWARHSWPGMGPDTFGHRGSNTTFYTLTAVAPERNAAVVINANVADESAVKAVDAMLDRITARLRRN